MGSPVASIKKFQSGLTKRSTCSFGLRTELNQDRPPVGPGPHQYMLPPSYTRFGKDSNPSFSMGRRINHLEASSSPGPGMYSVEGTVSKIKSSGPSFSLKGRVNLPVDNCTPGPNAYTIPDTIGKNDPNKPFHGTLRLNGRPKENLQSYNRSPGPAEYTVPDVNAYKKKTPQFTITGRKTGVFDVHKSQTPSPCAYTLDNTQSKVGCSFGVKHSSHRTNYITQNDK